MVENEGSKLELEIAGILLGLIFVVESILVTVPESLLEILGRATVYGLGFADFVIPLCLGSFLLLLVSVVFYLVFIGTKTKFLLMLGRTFLAIGLQFVVLLSMSFLVAVSLRLKPVASAVAYVNPLFGYVFVISLFITITAIVVLWIRYLLGKFRKPKHP